MSRPLIGIVCCTRTIGHDQAQAVMERYVTAAMRHADVAALLVPSLPELMDAGEVAPRIDGLLLTGSPSNVEPARYGEPDAEGAEGPWDPRRDRMSTDLVQACLDLGKPVFGICRGLQELNVAFGGTLRRDLGKSGVHASHHAPQDASWDDMFRNGHEVELAEDGMLARAFGKRRIHVNSVHFQGIDRLADHLQVEATATDGIIEAVSANINGATVLGVQWHPEWQSDDDPNSIAYFQLLGRVLRGEARP